jgi:hypothetical protein
MSVRGRQYKYIGVIIGLLVLGGLLSMTAAERTANVSPMLAENENDAVGVFNTFAPLGPQQERHLVVEVEAYGGHDNAFSTWTLDISQRWPAEGVRQDSIIVSDPNQQQVAHIVLDGTRSLLGWEPDNALRAFDVPLEYSVWSRAFDFTAQALSDPATYHLTREQTDAQQIIHFTWTDHHAQEFGYRNDGMLTINRASQQAEELTWLIDRPEHEPYPIRRFTIATVELLPAGTSDDILFTLDGTVLTQTALLAPLTTRAQPSPCCLLPPKSR